MLPSLFFFDVVPFILVFLNDALGLGVVELGAAFVALQDGLFLAFNIEGEFSQCANGAARASLRVHANIGGAESL